MEKVRFCPKAFLSIGYSTTFPIVIFDFLIYDLSWKLTCYALYWHKTAT